MTRSKRTFVSSSRCGRLPTSKTLRKSSGKRQKQSKRSWKKRRWPNSKHDKRKKRGLEKKRLRSLANHQAKLPHQLRKVVRQMTNHNLTCLSLQSLKSKSLKLSRATNTFASVPSKKSLTLSSTRPKKTKKTKQKAERHPKKPNKSQHQKPNLRPTHLQPSLNLSQRPRPSQRLPKLLKRAPSPKSQRFTTLARLSSPITTFKRPRWSPLVTLKADPQCRMACASLWKE